MKMQMKMQMNPMDRHVRRYWKCRACRHVLVTINNWYGEHCPVCRGSMRELDSKDKDVAVFIREQLKAGKM